MNQNLNSRIEEYGLEVFGIKKPFDAQYRFLKSQKKNVLFCGGRGAGKTTMGVLKLLLTALDPRCAGKALAILAPTYRQLVKIHEKMLQSYFQEFERNAGWSLLKRHRRADHIYELVNGAEIWCQSFERVERVRGMSLASAYIDELSSAGGDGPWYTFQVIGASVRDTGNAPCQIFLSHTPRGFKGVTKLFVNEVREKNPDFQILTCTTYDNPYLPTDFVQRLEQTMSKSMLAQEVYAKILRPVNVVYPSFSRKDHVVPYEHDRDTPFSIFADWGYSHPYFCFVAHLSSQGEHDRDVIFHEFAADDIPEQVLIDRIVEDVSKFSNVEPTYVVGDRAVPRMQQMMLRCFRSSRIKSMKSKDEQRIWQSTEVIRSRLEPAQGPPKLFCAESLLKKGFERGMIPMFEQLRRKIINGEQADVIHKDNVYDHAHDALRYGMMTLHKRSSSGMEIHKDEPTGVYARRMKAFGR